MIGRTFIRQALATTALAAAIAAAPAAAQLAAPAPVRESIDGNGVDLFLGTFNTDAPALTIGGSQGLSYYKLNRGGGWFDNITASIDKSGSTMTIAMGGKADTFTISGTTYTATEGNGATLTFAGTVYTYTRSDGTVAHFDKNKATAAPYYASEGRVTDIVSPSGEKLTFSYSSLHYCAATKAGASSTICLRWADAYRVGSVGNGYGYRIALVYPEYEWYPNDLDAGLPDFTFWSTPTGVSAANLAVSGGPTPGQSFNGTTSGGNYYLTITDALSRDTVYRTTSSGLSGIKLPGSSGEDVTVTYSASKVASITTAIGTTYYAYADASGIRTVTVTNPAGKATTYTFDIASARMKSATDATSRGTTWDYDTSGRVTKVTSQEGNYTQLTYDARGNVKQTDLVSKAGTSTLSTYAGYDLSCTNPATCNQPNTTTDARGAVTDYAYDANGNLLTVTAPAPTSGAIRPTTSYGYTSLQAYFDKGSGIVASGEPVYRLTSTSTCRTTASCADGADETRTIVDYGPQTSGTGNNLLPVSTTTKAGDNSLSTTTRVAYDAIGNVTSVDGPMSGSDDSVTYRYDVLRRRVGAIAPDPDGSGGLVRAAAKTTYNTRGIAYLNEVGTVSGTSDSDWAAFSSAQQVTATLDAAGRVTRSMTTAGGTTYGVTEYSYDLAGRPDCVAVRMNAAVWGTPTAACTAQTMGNDGPDRISRTIYDDAGRTRTTTSAYGTADAATEQVTYTGNGKLETATDAENNTTSYEYDGFDRPVKTQYPSTTKGAGASNASDYEELSYDNNGNVTNRRLRDGNSIVYTYDALNRVTLKDLPGSELDVTYTYNLLGQTRTAATSAQTVTLDYDALGRLSSDAQPYGTVSYQYDAAGRRTRTTWPDAFYVTYDYDTAGKLTTIKESGTTTLTSFAYDSLGRRTSQTRGNGVVTNYTFDNASRLIQLASDPTGTSGDLTLGFGYNNGGQIKSTTRSNDAYSWTGAVNVNRGYTANGLNQFTASGATSLAYDTRGNLNASGSDSYTYSSENLLMAATVTLPVVGTVTATLSYDPLLRLGQVSNTSIAASRFVYDGGNIVAQATTSGVFNRRYVLFPGSDEIVAEYKPMTGQINWKLLDERGSVIAAMGTDGVTGATNTYDEYGIPGSGNAMRYQYTGQVWLGEVGLYYYKARLYSPTLGRFMQTDPIGYGDGLNWYNYVKGDPVNARDSSGHFGLLGGCPAGNHCYSTNPDSSNAAAIEGRIHRELPGASSALVSATALCIVTSGCAAAQLMGFDAPYIERVGVSRSDPFRFIIDYKDSNHSAKGTALYYYYLVDRDGKGVKGERRVVEHIVNPIEGRYDRTGSISADGFAIDYITTPENRGVLNYTSTQTFSVRWKGQMIDLISIFEHVHRYDPATGQFNFARDITPGLSQ